MEQNRPYEGLFKGMGPESRCLGRAHYPHGKPLDLRQTTASVPYQSVYNLFHGTSQPPRYQRRKVDTNHSNVGLGQQSVGLPLSEQKESYTSKTIEPRSSLKRPNRNPIQVVKPYVEPTIEAKPLPKVQFAASGKLFDIIKNQEHRHQRFPFEHFDSARPKGIRVHNLSVKPCKGLRYDTITGKLMHPLP